MVQSASFRRSIGPILLILVVTSPFLIGTEPTIPCYRLVVTGRVLDPMMTPNAGATISLEVKRSWDSTFSTDHGYDGSRTDCPPGFREQIEIDTTGVDGSFGLSIGFNDEELYQSERDSFRLAVRIIGDSVYYDEPFGLRDTTSSTPIYYHGLDHGSMSGSGCSCSAEPVSFIGGYSFLIEGWDVVVP